MKTQIADFVASQPTAESGSMRLWQDPEARVYLAGNDEARATALKVCSLAQELFPECDISQAVIADPEDGSERVLLSIAFKLDEQSAKVAEFYDRLPDRVNTDNAFIDVAVFRAR